MWMDCLISGAASSRSQRVGADSLERAVDSSRQRNSPSTVKIKNTHLVSITLGMMPCISESVPTLLFDPFVNNFLTALRHQVLFLKGSERTNFVAVDFVHFQWKLVQNNYHLSLKCLLQYQSPENLGIINTFMCSSVHHFATLLS